MGKIIKLINLSFWILIIIFSNQNNIRNNIIKDKCEKSNYGNTLGIINNSKENYCFSFNDDSNIKIIHLIFTRFLFNFFYWNDFPNKMYNKEYILNGIRVMNKYLLPSLENQSCKNFIWILLLGNEANIAYVKSLLYFNYSFGFQIIKKKQMKHYLKNITKGFDVLITTRIDYDDRIYYDAVNDIRKTINIYKPILIHGYNRGAIYNELNDKYYDYYLTFKNNTGSFSIFASLIIFLNSTNNIYTIFDLGKHGFIRKNFIEKYRTYGIKKLNYEPAVFDSGGHKFVWVRQKYSGTISKNIPFDIRFKAINFNLSKFYGK